MVSFSSLPVQPSLFAEKQPFLDFTSPKRLEQLLFDSCPECHKVKMSSVPQGAYATWKVRMNEGKNQAPTSSNMMSARVKDSEKPSFHQPYYLNGFKKVLEQPPVKYNSKLMNSIWGLYNRYSVHNLKKITEGEEDFKGVQQPSGSQHRSHTL